MGGGRKGRMGEIREGFVEKMMFRQRGGRECKPCEMCSKGVRRALHGHCNPEQECAGSVSGAGRGSREMVGGLRD